MQREQVHLTACAMPCGCAPGVGGGDDAKHGVQCRGHAMAATGHAWVSAEVRKCAPSVGGGDGAEHGMQRGRHVMVATGHMQGFALTCGDEHRASGAEKMARTEHSGGGDATAATGHMAATRHTLGF